MASDSPLPLGKVLSKFSSCFRIWPWSTFQPQPISVSYSIYSILNACCTLTHQSLFMLQCSLVFPGSRRRHSLVFRMFIRECSWKQHPWKGVGGSRIGKREKSSCDASSTASAYRARFWESEMAHQNWPVYTRPQVRHLSGAEATPDKRLALPAPGTVNPSLKGNLCGAFVCPSHLSI